MNENQPHHGGSGREPDADADATTPIGDSPGRSPGGEPTAGTSAARDAGPAADPPTSPAPDAAGTAAADPGPAAGTSTGHPPYPVLAAPPTPPWRNWRIMVPATVVAAGLVLGGGIGGFIIGHAAADRDGFSTMRTGGGPFGPDHPRGPFGQDGPGSGGPAGGDHGPGSDDDGITGT